MGKIIIRTAGLISDQEALQHVLDVVKVGRVSDDGGKLLSLFNVCRRGHSICGKGGCGHVQCSAV